MAKVVARKDESVESLIRRFKKKVDKDGILMDMYNKEFYKSPSVKRREKHENALKRARKAAKKHEGSYRD